MTPKSFPNERVNNFSDAIFAIGITLLVLEIKIPTPDEVAQLGIWGVVNKRMPNFTGYFISFVVTALYWKNHLQLFQLVKAIDNKLLWLNLWLLFFVVLLPFSTALYSYFFFSNEAFIFYFLNLAAIGLMNCWLTVYVVKKEQLMDRFGEMQARWMMGKTLIAPLIFIFTVPLVLVAPLPGRFGFVLIFILEAVGTRIVRKRAQKNQPQITTHTTQAADHPDR